MNPWGKVSVPVLIGGSQASLQRDYHIESTPSTYLLNEEGEILFWEDGYTAGDEKILEGKIASALKVAPPAGDSGEGPACTTAGGSNGLW